MERLREIQARHRGDADVRALLAEIKRLHQKLVSIEDLRETIDKSWKMDVGGQLAALHILKREMLNEPAVMVFREQRPEPDEYSGPAF
ncbi:hypothetical protein [Robbsia sp. KACC 23696]|uniref:hypothetical protein n=1 Tax=Robbsia sp. KACC 23696 TaxID=3149231 RepID=UPI00325B6773